VQNTLGTSETGAWKDAIMENVTTFMDYYTVVTDLESYSLTYGNDFNLISAICEYGTTFLRLLL
jgi:hypothetical protein